MENVFSLLISYLYAVGGFFSFDSALLTQPEMVWRLLLQLVLLMGSAFFSASETALFSLSRLDLHELRRNQSAQSATLRALLDQPRRLIISTLCGNILINIAAIANMASILVPLYGVEKAALINVLVMVPLLLLVGEITPKTLAISNPVRISSKLIAAPMALWVRFITPLLWILRETADLITRWIVGEEKAPENILQLDEFRIILDEVSNEGELHDTERTLIYHLLDAGATEIVEIMTPRPRVAFINNDRPLAEIIKQFRSIRHSRVPVYQTHRDNVIGMLHIEDILPLALDDVDLDTLTLDNILHPPIIVPPTKKVDEMFDFFQTHKARAAIVMDEFGGVEGLVTVQDLLTFIFGHLSGELSGVEFYQEQDQNIYEVPGEMKLTDFNDLTNFGLEDPRMTTIAGVAFRHLDRLPVVGDKVQVEGLEITVLEIREHRIVRVRVARGETLPPGNSDKAPSSVNASHQGE